MRALHDDVQGSVPVALALADVVLEMPVVHQLEGRLHHPQRLVAVGLGRHDDAEGLGVQDLRGLDALGARLLLDAEEALDAAGDVGERDARGRHGRLRRIQGPLERVLAGLGVEAAAQGRVRLGLQVVEAQVLHLGLRSEKARSVASSGHCP